MLEKDLQRCVIDYLDARNIRYLRLNAGDSIREGANGQKYRIRGAAKGTADLLILAYKEIKYDKNLTYIEPRPIFVELKSAKGKQTADQQQFEAIIKEIHYEYYVVRDLDELIEVLK